MKKSIEEYEERKRIRLARQFGRRDAYERKAKEQEARYLQRLQAKEKKREENKAEWKALRRGEGKGKTRQEKDALWNTGELPTVPTKALTPHAARRARLRDQSKEPGVEAKPSQWAHKIAAARQAQRNKTAVAEGKARAEAKRLAGVRVRERADAKRLIKQQRKEADAVAYKQILVDKQLERKSKRQKAFDRAIKDADLKKAKLAAKLEATEQKRIAKRKLAADRLTPTARKLRAKLRRKGLTP